MPLTKLVFTLSLVFLSLNSHIYAQNSTDWAPIYEKRQINDLTQHRALGPIFDYRLHDNGDQLLAIRPFYSKQTQGDREVSHYLWPLAAKFKSPDYTRAYYGPLFTSRRHQSEVNEYATWLMPVYYQGRDRQGEEYRALWPIWGQVHDMLGYDRIGMNFFPLHLYLKKNNIHTHSYLWPIISNTRGPGLHKWRVFPFYGGVKQENSYENRWIMWPFWTHGKSLNKKKPGSWFFAFPFYGKVRYQDLEETTILWPFYTKTVNKKGSDLRAPWPFYRHRTYKEEGEELKQFWPFYQEHRRPNEIGHYALWPFYTDWSFDDGKKKIDRQYILPFYWQFLNRQDGKTTSHTRFWPFYSKTTRDDHKIYRVLDIWPSQNDKAIEKNYAPFWTLFQRQKYKTGSQWELLWGWTKYQNDDEKKSFSLFPFYSQEKKEEQKSWSILKGLVSRQETAKEKKWKLLWFIPWTSKKKTAEAE